jgi:glutamate:GABA antiporter
MMSMPSVTRLSTFTLAMLITGTVDSIRNLPASALFGSTLIFFFVFSAIVFLIPAALVSAELSAKMPDEGGIYKWIRAAFGEKAGFLAIWLQWISNVFWFPTIFSFVAGTATYLISPELAQNKVYLVTAILAILWFLTWINLKGIHVAAKFTSFCTIFGLIIPMALIITLGLVWLAIGQPLQVHFTLDNMFPHLQQSENWIGLTAIMTAFCGMELATVHIREVDNPQKAFPRALLLSVLLILFTMILGSLSIAFVLPAQEINLVNGVMQTFSYFLSAYHLSWLMPLLTLMLIVGSMGGIISWLISPVKGMLHAAQQDFLPPFLKYENSKGVPQNLLIGQSILITFVCLSFLMMPSVNGSYWLLTALSTQLYMMMYIMMFIAGIYLRYKKKTEMVNNAGTGFTIPGGHLGAWLICFLGIIGCCITLAVGFIPPEALNIGSTMRYELMFVGGLVLMIMPVGLSYLYKNRKVAAAFEKSAVA